MSRHKHRHHKHSHKHGRKRVHKSEGFKIIYKDCGTGRTKVSVVKRKSDGKLLIWKRARSEGTRNNNFYKNDIKKSKLWRKFGISTVRACVHPDKKSILRTYIKGHTLRQILKNNPEFFSGRETKYRKALKGFIKLLINSKHYIHDMKGANIVFSDGKWQVIDSGKAYKHKNRSDVVHEYRENLMEKWSRSIHSRNEIHYLGSFLDKYCI
jgi:tRNA A-37 threonylcarbamoyl transferase component Bud32